MKHFIGTTFLSSFLFAKAPGTASSLVVFLFFWAFPELSVQVKLALIVTTGLCHIFCFPYFEKNTGSSDPAIYTLDETFAMILLNIPFHRPMEWVSAFLLFRFFDIVKPLGIKKFEQIRWLSGSVRNLGDDIIAAFYSYLLLFFFQHVF